MLVLSRRAHQQIVFPNLGVTIEVLQLRGKLVKIGISAPRSVDIHRPESSEYLPDSEATGARDRQSGQLDHRLRNELNLLQLRLEVLQQRLDAGDEIDLETTLNNLVSGVDSLDLELSDLSRDAQPLGRRSLLVVEDSANERQLMAYTLACYGFEVQVARDGLEAMEVLHRALRLPDVVLMDLEMPMANGLDVLSHIRHDQRLQDVSVFAVTGSERNCDAEPMGRGWDDWFSKPLDMRRLVQRLTQLLSGAQPAASVVD